MIECILAAEPTHATLCNTCNPCATLQPCSSKTDEPKQTYLCKNIARSMRVPENHSKSKTNYIKPKQIPETRRKPQQTPANPPKPQQPHLCNRNPFCSAELHSGARLCLLRMCCSQCLLRVWCCPSTTSRRALSEKGRKVAASPHSTHTPHTPRL